MTQTDEEIENERRRANRARRKQLAQQAEAEAPINVRPFAAPARIRRRHRGLVMSFVVMVLLPLAVVALYLFGFARDQFASTTGFTIRQEETTSASELMGGLSQFMGGGGAGRNSDVLYEFIQSQQIVERVSVEIDLVSHYSADWSRDPIFSIWPDATVEDMLWFWRRMVRISYDRATGLIDVQVRARDRETAQAIAQAIVRESESMINALNEAARRDTMAAAERDLEESLGRLRAAREELAAFRARTQIVDPQADIQGRMGVLNNLQQQLAQALVDHDLLLQVTNDTDPRVRQAMRRIEVIRDRITEERRNFATQDVTVFDTDYPWLIAQFEGLRVDQEFAEQTYRAALTAYDAARSNALRQGLYLATYIRPTLAQRAEYPQRWLLSLLAAGFLTLGWAVAALVYYSLRDRS